MSSNYTAFICEDLKSKISSGKTFPFSLRKLADIYGCSTRPVGQAIDQLIEQQYLRRLDNGRLSLGTKTPRQQKTRATKDIRSPQQLRRDIESALILESLRGKPCYLREEKLAEHFGIGRTALRNIFTDIALSGLLSHEQHKGWKLRAFTEKDLNDFLTVREQMELMALDVAKSKLIKTDLEVYLTKNQEPKTKKDPPDNNEFHDYILDKADNHYINSFFEHHAPFFDQLFIWEDQDPKMQKQTRQQHRKILKAMIDKKWDAAKKALSHHIWNNHNHLIAMVRSMQRKASQLPTEIA